MNQYPTIFISFRQVDGLDFTGAYDMLTWVISELYKKHLYLMESDRINECDTLYNPKAKPISYWKNTSDNTIIRSFIDYAVFDRIFDQSAWGRLSGRNTGRYGCVYDSINGRVAIFEAKYTKVLNNQEAECDMALQQIDDRMYAKEYEDDYDQILCYGISFFKKRCMVKKK